MKNILFVFALLIVAGLGAQEAKVLPLKSDDSFEAKEAWYKLQDAQKEWDAVQSKVKEKYLLVPYGDKEAGNEILEPCSISNPCLSSSTNVFTLTGRTHQLSAVEEEAKAKREEQYRKEAEENRKTAHYQRKGWENGFQFSSDFKYIVPKPAPVYENNGSRIFLAPTIAN